jgi:homoserine dehydrogenase
MKPIRVSLLGCGTVGGGVLSLLAANEKKLASRIGAPLEVRKVLVRDPAKDRVPECRREWLTTNADEVLDDPELDVLLEVMGGIDPARGLIARALDRGASVVSANKMLVAHHGADLVERAARNNVDLAFEASVGGGIPIIRTLREAMTSDAIDRLAGIVNGTCNYILTRMREEGASFEDILPDAQARGYAEADPTLDVDGHDAAQKLVVLAMLAFGARVDASTVSTIGIRDIGSIDHRFAERFGFVIKHLAIGREHGDAVELRVHPTLVPRGSMMANVSGVLNAIQLHGRALGPCLLSGRGAGDLPTAVSVVADLVEVARARREGASGLATRGIRLESRRILPIEETISRFYLRFSVDDRPGVLATIAGTLGSHGVSIEQMVQEGRGDAGPVQVVMVTHTSSWGAIQASLSELASRDFSTGTPRVLRIEDP